MFKTINSNFKSGSLTLGTMLTAGNEIWKWAKRSMFDSFRLSWIEKRIETHIRIEQLVHSIVIPTIIVQIFIEWTKCSIRMWVSIRFSIQLSLKESNMLRLAHFQISLPAVDIIPKFYDSDSKFEFVHRHGQWFDPGPSAATVESLLTTEHSTADAGASGERTCWNRGMENGALQEQTRLHLFVEMLTWSDATRNWVSTTEKIFYWDAQHVRRRSHDSSGQI